MDEKRKSDSIEHVINRMSNCEFQDIFLNNRMIVSNRVDLSEDLLPSKHNVVSIFNINSGTMETRNLLGFEADDRMAFFEKNNYDKWKTYAF